MNAVKELRRAARNAYRKNTRPLLAVSFAFTIVFIAAIVLNAALPGTGFLSVPLVVLPTLFCLQIAFSRLQQEGQLELKEFHHFYALGMSAKFRQSYRALSSFFKALFLFILLVFAFGIVASYVVPYFDPEFAALSEDLVQLASQTTFNYEEMATFLETHYDVFLPIINGVACLALAFSSLYFFGAIAANMMAVHFALTSPGDGRFVSLTHRTVMMENHRDFRRLFLGMAWPGILLYVIGFASGSILAWFTFADYWMIANFGMIFGVLLLWPFLPILLSTEEQLYKRYASRYSYHMTMQFKAMVNDLAAYKDLNPEEKEEIAELKKQASELEKKLAENDAPKNEEKKSDDANQSPDEKK